MSEQKDADAAWRQFQADLTALRDQVRAHGAGPALQASLDRLGTTADEVVGTLREVARDPQVRAGTQVAARSFGAALGDTLKKIGEDLATAFKSEPPASP